MKFNYSKKPSKKSPKKPSYKQLGWYLILSFVILMVISTSFGASSNLEEVSFSQFLTKVKSGQIKQVEIRSREQLLVAKTTSGERFKTNYVNYTGFFKELQDNKVAVQVNNTDSSLVWSIFIQALLPFLLIGFLWFFIFRQAQGAGNQALSFGKSKASMFEKTEDVPKVTFKDIAGADEAVEELREIVSFLKDPSKFKKLGAKIPKGALLMGSPGTGKTLLAKAIAGEANVPFFNISGSEFVEMFVGVGASRVRDLFAKAKKVAPAIVFVDEIDAVGRHRGAGLGGGHDEREQTLNQLLVEMDGFNDETTVIVIAATNRPDILDPALLRPGRFDRQITVDKPDLKGREDILGIHSKNVKMDKNVLLSTVARATSGFTGADLANLINEAALLAARKDKKKVETSDLEESIERVVAGPQRKSRVMSEHEKRVIAYHEIGHAFVAAMLPDSDPVHKVSILPRGMALGYTLQLPEADKFLVARQEMINKIKVLLAGRIAEDIVFSEVTSGASNDIERATELARGYVCKYGMSERLGMRKYGTSNGNVFLGKTYSDDTKDYSETTAHEIDEEIKRLLDTCYSETKVLMKDNRKILDYLASELLEKEVIERDEFLKMLENKSSKANITLAESKDNKVKSAVKRKVVTKPKVKKETKSDESKEI